jgi:hypothetical protein
MTKLLTLACLAGASFALASSWPLVADAQATRPEVTVSPPSVVPSAQYFATTHKFAGTGAVVTVRVGPNKVLIPAFPVEVMECDPYPSSQSDCDMITTLPYDQLTKRRDLAGANGSVTFHFLLWAPLPNGWDAGSVLKVGRGNPTALWIGDDPSHWASSGLVSAPVQITNKAVKATKSGKSRKDTRPRNATAALADKSISSPHRTSAITVALVAVVAVIAGVAGGVVATSGRRRRRVAQS